ncbi:MAG: hypothetical protein BGO26_20780 [Actinobacteria bacterium 69-20]|jgi:hypothetical protein|nr:MAG: hypothetical protein BGO26_20780 [Actinobacteria bacterium 69-20]
MMSARERCQDLRQYKKCRATQEGPVGDADVVPSVAGIVIRHEPRHGQRGGTSYEMRDAARKATGRRAPEGGK